ncbi:MAG: hypothetical protein FWB85_04935 [Chitinispirillia bacterium]|nr:hypothetical protein [Chitinispirillia bacterium]
MEAVRQIVDSNSLSGIIPLPVSFRGKKVEVVVSLTEDEMELPPLSEVDIDAMLKGSITESLIGILSRSDKTLADYRAERLSRYECAD